MCQRPRAAASPSTAASSPPEKAGNVSSDAEVAPSSSPAPEAEATPSVVLRILTEISTISHLAWPQSLNGVTSFMPRLFLLASVGHLENGAMLIGAAGIGSMFANACHLMLIRSSTMGAAPLFSQAFGAGNHTRIGHVLQRVLLLHALMVACISLPLTAAAGPLLAAFGQPLAIANYAQLFVWIRLLGLPGLVAFTDVQAFLNAQRCVRLPMVVGSSAAVIQCVLISLLTKRLGFVGAPIAMTVVELLQGLVLVGVTPALLRRHKLRSWPAWRREARQACRGWAEIISKGAPAAIMVTAEWFGWECTLFMASGLCSDGADTCPAVEAIPICTTLFVLQFIIAFGPGVASNSIRVGNLLGEGRPDDARFCAGVAWGMQVSIQCSLVAFLLTFRTQIASLFVDDPEVLAHATSLMRLTTVYSFFATMAPGWSQQLLFGLGAKLTFPAAWNVVCFFVVGLPVGSFLGYSKGLAEEGIWMGLLLAMILIVIGQYAYLAVTTDWALASRKARERALVQGKGGAGAGAGWSSDLANDESDGRGLAMADSAAAREVET